MARVLVTRAAEDASGLCHALRQLGHTPVRVPLLSRVWDVDAVAQVAAEHPRVDWVIVTSGAAADVLAAAAPGAWLSAHIGAVGPTTGRKLAALGRPPMVSPREHTGVELVRAMGDLSGKVVVYPHADLAPTTTADALRAAGATVLDVVAYRNVQPSDPTEALSKALPVDFTPILSGSAARRLKLAWPGSVDALGDLIAIGPTTAKATRAAGLPVHHVAHPYTLEGVLTTLQSCVVANRTP